MLPRLTAVYVIEMGGNDVRDAFVEFAAGRNGGAILHDAHVSISAGVQTLHAAGARRFLIWRTPNVGVTPALLTLDRLRPGAAQFATLVTQWFNAGLDVTVSDLRALPDIDIARLDAFGLVNDSREAPQRLCFDECHTGVCQDPRAIHLRPAGRVSVLGRHSPDDRRSRNCCPGGGARVGAVDFDVPDLSHLQVVVHGTAAL